MAFDEDRHAPESKDQSCPSAIEDKYNVEAADNRANELLRLPITEATPMYEHLLTVFPTAAKYWKQYAEANMAVNNDDAVKQIFSRCLLTCLQVPLWRCYIRYIRMVNDKKGPEGQEETRKAFDFMLNYVGTDIASGPVWIEYIAFLKSLPASNPQEESLRMIALRKVYQRAIVTPTHHVEQLWKDYENFENSVSRQLAKGLISEYQPKFNSARAVYRELKKYTDEIDLNILAVPPTGSSKEEMQWIAWKKLLAFEKGNPQRIDKVSSNKRITFTYEQCLMHLYHYPDMWYEYATWLAKCVSIDSAIKVFQRAQKALPDAQMVGYAYAELEESRGALQSAKKIYESLLGDGVNTTALAHIQFIRFLRRTEGVEAARKYFLDARKSPTCTYHVFVAYAMTAFCLDKDSKMAHNVFEAGLKRFMNEPVYILEYADFLTRLNDDRNIRALFERALSSLPPENSVEIWKRFTQFEQTYGDLASMLKVEQRRKKVLLGTDEDGSSELEGSLHDVVSRYSFMDLWPCSTKDLDHLARLEWLAKSINKKPDGSPLGGPGFAEKGTGALLSNVTKISYPDVSQMAIYDPQKNLGSGNVPSSGVPESPSILTNPTTAVMSGQAPNPIDELFKSAPPALLAFLTNLPAVDVSGPTPNVDIVLSICLQSDIPRVTSGNMKAGTGSVQLRSSGAPSTSDLSAPSYKHPSRGKRKGQNWQDEDDTRSVQSQPLPQDAFRIRQFQKARRSASQTGSASYGSALSGDLSGSTG